jgi:hypothetical protein
MGFCIRSLHQGAQLLVLLLPQITVKTFSGCGKRSFVNESLDESEKTEH